VKSHIGSYSIEKRIGDGGRGVWKCFDKARGCSVAVRALGASAASESDLRRLRDVAGALKRVDDGNVCAFEALIEHDGEMFVVTDLVDGETLEERLASGEMSTDDAIAIGAQVLGALHSLHSVGVVHGSVRPSNVMIASGRVKLMDCGVHHIASLLHRSLRRARDVVPYLSPEQLHSTAAIDHRSDVYSTGVLLYRLIGKRLPFEESDDAGALHSRLDAPRELTDLVPGLRRGIDDVIAIALRREPAERFQSAALFREALLDGAAGFFPASPSVPDSAPDPLSAEAVTPAISPPRATGVAQARPHKRRPVVSWIFTGGSLLISSVLLIQSVLRPTPPPVTTTVEKHPVIVKTPPVIASVTPPSKERKKELKKPPVTETIREPRPFPKRDTEADRRDEIDLLSMQISDTLGRAKAKLEDNDLDGAHDDLDAAAVKAARYPEDFRAEIDEIRRVNGLLNAKRVDAQIEVQRKILERSQWDRRLAEVQRDFDEKDYTGAKKAAIRLLAEPGLPDWVAAPATELRNAAQKALVGGFTGTQTSPVQNNVRRPGGRE